MGVVCELQDSPVTDVDLKSILSNAKTVAIVEMSTKKDNPSHNVAKYLQEHGFRLFAVNPNCDEVLGEKCYPDLKSIPEDVDVVDIFRRPDAIGAIVEEAIEIKAGTVWMQLGLQDEDAAQKARCAGLNVVMNRCMKMEHSRHFGNGTT
jgi:predicted CoA-binding protein